MKTIIAPIANMTEGEALDYVREIAQAARQRSSVAYWAAKVVTTGEQLAELLVSLDEPTLTMEEREAKESHIDSVTRAYTDVLLFLDIAKRNLTFTENRLEYRREKAAK